MSSEVVGVEKTTTGVATYVNVTLDYQLTKANRVSNAVITVCKKHLRRSLYITCMFCAMTCLLLAYLPVLMLMHFSTN